MGFKGDIRASAVKRLGREIDAVLTVARPDQDEVVVRIESPGGTVTGYGLAASQLLRLRAASIKLTACVDQVAASGGYLMACVADRIIAAPFAILGSIGVVAQVPNLNRLLKKNDIDFEEMTAGEFKRSVSIFGEITPAGREHFRGKLDATHEAFKEFVGQNRPGSTSPRSPTATPGSAARRWSSASSTNWRRATIISSACAIKRGFSRFRRRSGSLCCSNCWADWGSLRKPRRVRDGEAGNAGTDRARGRSPLPVLRRRGVME